MAIKAIIASEFNPLGIRQAQAEFRKFRKSVADAQGVTGKFKAGLDSAAGSFKKFAASPGGASAIIATVGTAAFNAANEFAALSKAAIDLSKATGLSTEEASRWIAVGDDFEVSAETLTRSIGRIGKTLDGSSWEKYGIATRDAAGQARSANDILIDALDVLSRTRNETQRAKIGNDLFGRGYAQLAPLVGKTRNEYERMLSSVEDGQVITTKEAENAERWRLAQDELNDSLNEFTYALGEATVELAPFVSFVADAVKLYSRIESPIAGVSETIRNIGIQFGLAERPAVVFNRAMGGLYDSTGEAARMAAEYQRSREGATDADEEAVPSLQDVNRELEKQLQLERDLVQLQLSSISTQLGYQSQVLETSDAIADYNELQQQILAGTYEGTDANRDLSDAARQVYEETIGNAEAAVRWADEQAKLNGKNLSAADIHRIQVDELQKVADTLAPGSLLRTQLEAYIGQLETGLPKEVATDIALDNYSQAFSNATRYREELLKIPRRISTALAVTYGDAAVGLLSGRLAAGGPVAAGRTYLVGEEGPELFTPSTSGMIVPNHELVSGAVSGGGSVAGGSVVLNVTVTNPVASGEQLANELAAYTRRNGSRWLAGVV